MANSWFVYKNQQYYGPYTWENLVREAQNGNIKPNDLVWNKEIIDWTRAEQAPGLLYQSGPGAAGPNKASAKNTPTMIKKPAPAKKPSYLAIATIAAAVFFVVMSGTALYYLFIYTGPPVAKADEETADPFLTVMPEEEDFQHSGLLKEDYPADPQDEKEDNAALNDASINYFAINGDEQAAETPQEPEDKEPEEVKAEQRTDSGPEAGKDENDLTAPADQSISWRGGTYSGPLHDGEPHGLGSWTHPGGKKYEGDFYYGKIEGYGLMSFPGGEKYLGYLRNGKAHGQGTLTSPDGRKYEGNFSHGIIAGYGVMTFPNGEKYYGYLKDGKAHGEGTMIHPDGNKISGHWTAGVLEQEG